MRCVAVIAPILLLAAFCSAQDIALRNPGFEVDENDDGMPDGWNFSPHGEGWSVGITDAQAHSGEHSVFITGMPDHGDRAAIVQISRPAPVRTFSI